MSLPQPVQDALDATAAAYDTALTAKGAANEKDAVLEKAQAEADAAHQVLTTAEGDLDAKREAMVSVIQSHFRIA